MIIPIRCFTCGKPVAHLWEDYKKLVKKGEDPKKALDALGVERYCCRALFISNIDLLATIGRYKKF